MAGKHDPFVWLAPERTDNASAYSAYASKIRKTLISFFAGNRCDDAENLASECLFRLTMKLGTGALPHLDDEGRRAAYLRGMARIVLLEWRHRAGRADVPLEDEDSRPQFQVWPVDLIQEQCLELYREAIRKQEAHFRRIEPEILTMLRPERGHLDKLARARGVKPATMRKRAERVRDRFLKLLADYERFDDLKRCLGIGWD